MPRRNRNAGTPRLDADQLAADLDRLTADLCPSLSTGCGKGSMPVRYLTRTVTPSSLLVVTGGTQQAIPQIAAGSG